LAGGLSSDRITAVLSSRVDPTALWAGTERGLNRIDIRTGRIEYWRRRPDGLADDHIRALAESRDGTIWIGTENRGLHRLDPNTGRFMRLPSSPEAGPSDGPVHRTITAIFEDRNGLLWVGTEAGLSRFDQKTKLWIHLNEQAGLPGPSVRGILEDDAGRIWVSTDGGVVRINPGTGILGEFDLSDGLQAEEFNFGAVVRDSSGRLLFGGPNGLNVVDPGRIERSFPSVVVLTRFTRSGRSAPSARPLSRLNSIGIRMNEFVVLEFAALSFAGPGRLHYAGKLEGRDREWFALGPHREIELANLNPGRYILHVGIPSFAGGRIVNESTWSIRVVRPLRASPVFWLVILGGAGAALAAFFRSRRKRSIRPERILIPDDEAVLLRVAEKFRLSGREIELLKLILGGQTNDEISRTLFISPSTVRNHVSNIYQKLHVRSRIQLLNLLKKHSGDLDPN
jgi:ligand-binding sensor domain-containing protein/DNA-binding CsgD family transcriptional regulator